MCSIAGNNLFGQWYINDDIVTEFRDIPLNIPAEDSSTTTDMKILEVHWSYNIFRTEDSFFISGTWGGREIKLEKINLPSEFNIADSNNILMTGNDYYLFFVRKHNSKLWLMDENGCIREISFSESPLNRSPKRKKADSEIKKIKVIGDNFLCLTDSGIVYSGMLPSLVNTEHCLGSVSDIDCGFEHFMLLTDAGRVYTWGNGRRLQLGHGDLDNLEIPTEVEALAGIKIIKISAGGWHSAALSEFGDLYIWGWNDMGQLGIRSDRDEEKTTSDILSSCVLPTLVDFFDSNGAIVNLNVKDFACGTRHTALILEDNSVWTSGCNKYGQLGFEPSLYSSVNYFKKAFQCKVNSKILCGPWTTVLKYT